MPSFLKLRTLWIIPLLLSSILPAAAADKEQREPKEPVFNAAATQLAYREDVTKAGEVLSSSSEIWIINRNGTNARALTSGFKDSHPRFNPDGTLIAFTRDRDIWTVNVDGSNLRNVTNTKDATENKAEFTKDGDLVFLRDSIETPNNTLTSNASIDPLIFALGFGATRQSVILHSLKDNKERVLLGDGYEVSQIAPNPVFGDAIFIICKPLDNDGKPVGKNFAPDKVVAVVKLDGGAPRTVFAPKPEAKTIIEQVRVTPQRNVLLIKTPDDSVGHAALLENDELIPLQDAPIFSDVSQDGKTIAGTGIVKGQASLFGIMLYDIETKTTRQLIAPGK
jgi:dipeptidyl aminopeptidase/acylaminoacyl peptidase